MIVDDPCPSFFVFYFLYPIFDITCFLLRVLFHAFSYSFVIPLTCLLHLLRSIAPDTTRLSIFLTAPSERLLLYTTRYPSALICDFPLCLSAIIWRGVGIKVVRGTVRYDTIWVWREVFSTRDLDTKIFPRR